VKATCRLVLFDSSACIRNTKHPQVRRHECGLLRPTTKAWSGRHWDAVLRMQLGQGPLHVACGEREKGCCSRAAGSAMEAGW
jgi:hypothetical protein